MQTHANTKPYCKVGKQLPETASQGRLHLQMTWPTSAQANLWSSYTSQWLSTSQLHASSFIRPKKAIFSPLRTVEEFLLVKPIVIKCQLISFPALKAERGRQALLSSQDFVSLRRSCDFFLWRLLPNDFSSYPNEPATYITKERNIFFFICCIKCFILFIRLVAIICTELWYTSSHTYIICLFFHAPRVILTGFQAPEQRILKPSCTWLHPTRDPSPTGRWNLYLYVLWGQLTIPVVISSNPAVCSSGTGGRQICWNLESETEVKKKKKKTSYSWCIPRKAKETKHNRSKRHRK